MTLSYVLYAEHFPIPFPLWPLCAQLMLNCQLNRSTEIAEKANPQVGPLLVRVKANMHTTT